MFSDLDKHALGEISIVGVDLELGVGVHLRASVPVSDRCSSPGSVVTAAATIGQLDRSRLEPLGEVSQAGQVNEHHVTGLAFDQGCDRLLTGADNQVPFPVLLDEPILDLGWSFADHDLGRGRPFAADALP